MRNSPKRNPKLNSKNSIALRFRTIPNLLGNLLGKFAGVVFAWSNKGAANMRPSICVPNPLDMLGLHPIFAANFTSRNPIRQGAENAGNLLFTQPRMAVSAASIVMPKDISAMLKVFLASGPFQIFNSVVCAVAINVVHICLIWSRSREKCECNQPMNSLHGGASVWRVKADYAIPVAGGLLEKTKFSRYATSYLPVGRHFVQVTGVRFLPLNHDLILTCGGTYHAVCAL